MLTALDLLVVVILGVVFFVYWMKFGPGAQRKKLLSRVDQIQRRHLSVSPTSALSLRRQTEKTSGIVNLIMKPLPDFKRLGDRLERAEKKMSAKQFVFRRIMYFVGITFLCAAGGLHIMLAIAIGLILGVWFPFKLLKRAIAKQNKAFLRLFPDALDLIVRGLRSGLPVSESLVLVSQEIPAPVGTMFSSISSTMKLGVPMEKALLEIAKKLELTEFNFFTTSIVLQRETGGNLAEILNNLSEVLRNRYIMRMKIKAMSSEARASAYIIGALPFVVFLAVMVITPDYMTPLWEDYRGNICVAIAVGMMTFGGWIMNRMTQFEI
ncbi:MAG: type II secretion system F family protein [Rickettsiales bacterium]